MSNFMLSEEKNITYIGHKKNIKRLLEEVDCLILPSYREGLSNVVLEALSMEVPVIASNVPGCKDIVLHNKTGLLVNKEDPESIKDALTFLMNNKNLCKNFGENVRVHIEKNFTNEIINNQTFDLYKKIIGRK